MNELIYGTLDSINRVAMDAIISCPPGVMGSYSGTLQGKAFAFIYSQRQSLSRIISDFDRVGVKPKDLAVYIPDKVFGELDAPGPFGITIRSYPGYLVIVGFEMRLETPR